MPSFRTVSIYFAQDVNDVNSFLAVRRAIRHRIQNLRSILTVLGRGTTRDGVGSGLFRDRRAADEKTEEKKEDDKKDEKKDDEKKEPSFLEARIKRLREAIEQLTKSAQTVNEQRRQLLFKRIDTLRALLDRLLRRKVSETKTVVKREAVTEPASEIAEVTTVSETSGKVSRLTRRVIRKYKELIKDLTEKSKKVRGQQRELLFKQIDALRALTDRLMGRSQ